jgi:hypothetical protein
MDPTGAVARRFPLIARPRPVCVALPARVAAVCDLAGQAATNADPVLALTVYNQAALIASDCGLPELARRWCYEHARLYVSAQPQNAVSARNALEPLVNLARLLIRDGQGEAAYQLLADLHQAVRDNVDTSIDGIPVRPSRLVAAGAARHDLRRWLWTVLLSDGTRALTNAGRWHDAHRHLQRHKGIGQRMHDGRQVAIIAHAVTGDHDTALALLDDTTPGEAWENAVTACLTVLCGRSARNMPASTADVMQRYEALTPAPPLVAFQARLALSIIDAAHGIDEPAAARIATTIADRTLAAGDGYAARDILTHPACAATLTCRQAQGLAHVLRAAGLGAGAISPGSLAALMEALAASQTVLVHALGSAPTPGHTGANID